MSSMLKGGPDGHFVQADVALKKCLAAFLNLIRLQLCPWMITPS